MTFDTGGGSFAVLESDRESLARLISGYRSEMPCVQKYQWREEIMKRATAIKAGAVAAILSSLALAAPAVAGPFTQCSDHWLFWSGYQLIMEAIFDLCG